MALQTIEAIVCGDMSNPKELQAWFDAHPLAIITDICVRDNVFYVIHT